MQNITWSALEHEERNHGNDWFWALGVIIVTASLAAIIYGNYFFAALIVLSGVLLGFLANKKPEYISYELNEKGFVSHTNIYAYENIKSFWVQRENFAEDPTKRLRPLLFLKSERFFMPIILTPIDNTMASEIRDFLLEKNIPEEEMKETFGEKIMDALGF